MPDSEIELLLAEHGVITVAESPHLRHRLERRTAAGLLRRALPGVYVRAGTIDRHAVDAMALRAADPDAVLAGRSAAVLSFAEDLAPETVTAYRRGEPRNQAGFCWWPGPVPPELVEESDGIRRTAPALTVLDLIDELGTEIIDQGLRAGVRLTAMQEALRLTPHRPGNRRRAAMLHDSRDEPWSEAERVGHRLLRESGVTGWRANQATVKVDGRWAIGDVVWRREQLVVEFDGWAFHRSHDSFDDDRWRDAALADAGWRVLRFTWWHLTERSDEVLALIRAALAR